MFYAHALKWPFPDYGVPEAHGLLTRIAGKTLNFKIDTPDNVHLGAWFMVSDSYYRDHRSILSSSIPSLPLDTIRDAVYTRPTILFLHGVSGTRTTATRMQFYAQLTSRLDTNVLTIDYRGFADSTGVPSEDGLETDAYTAWKWVIDQGAKEEDVLIVAIVWYKRREQARKELAHEGVKPRGIVLLAPFANLATLLETYPILRTPVFQPLTRFSLGRKILKAITQEQFDTLSEIKVFSANVGWTTDLLTRPNRNSTSPVLLAHAMDDPDIAYTHSHTLFDHLLSPLLPHLAHLSLMPGPVIPPEFEAYKHSLQQRHNDRALLVKKTEILNFGVVEEFETRNGKVVYVEAMWGGHNLIGLQEGVQYEIGKLFRLGGMGDLV